MVTGSIEIMMCSHCFLQQQSNTADKESDEVLELKAVKGRRVRIGYDGYKQGWGGQWQERKIGEGNGQKASILHSSILRESKPV